MLIETLTVLCAGLADRIRGGYPHDSLWDSPNKKWVREPVKYMYGCLMVSLLTSNVWLMLAAGPLWKFGAHQDFGSQFRIHRPEETGGWINVIRVGAVWPLLCMPLGYWDMSILWLWPASIAGNYFAQLYALKGKLIFLPEWFLGLHGRPGWSEFLRGTLIAAFCCLFATLEM